jgi:hypothetical protein
VVIFITRLDDRVRAASIRYATELGLQVAGALVKPVGAAALRSTPEQSTAPATEVRSSASRSTDIRRVA